MTTSSYISQRFQTNFFPINGAFSSSGCLIPSVYPIYLRFLCTNLQLLCLSKPAKDIFASFSISWVLEGTFSHHISFLINISYIQHFRTYFLNNCLSPSITLAYELIFQVLFNFFHSTVYLLWWISFHGDDTVFPFIQFINITFKRVSSCVFSFWLVSAISKNNVLYYQSPFRPCVTSSMKLCGCRGDEWTETDDMSLYPVPSLRVPLMGAMETIFLNIL